MFFVVSLCWETLLWILDGICGGECLMQIYLMGLSLGTRALDGSCGCQLWFVDI